MKIQLPKPFFFEEGKRAVLLLHGFTGNSSDVRQLGRYLQKKGYTSHAPHYEGHAAPPEEILESSPHVWYKNALDGYDYLVEQGYDEIAVAGLSLGGVYALKLSLNRDVKGIVTMCSPMYLKTEGAMFEGVLEYARNFKKYEGKDEATIEKEMEAFHPTNTLKELQETIQDVRDHVDEVFDPLFVVQAKQDKMINTDSANVIYEESDSDEKSIKWYENSGHVITIDKEKEQVFEDVYNFLESLDWSE
ncbi:alpha/beta hydrolase [Staphylococcus massiliensis]|uniref:Carboxylesterase n=1 Tax=Staphylococcus massiliensis S46 TaxID=1229783 RepID=K9AMG7_9STAP|nr:carboxylesterase [Staphylococcus massiliensis]EKU48479.1 carboxylesterase [Staphylococcus massiliensis S46]MCG3400398.1 carboxylesterase [Staphylococcus massiliensis]MCG3401755.1 carboxylesterase [Staphylococcus massiliensis]MCG3412627.1 carboxylesterase [Staphylococcus massiliensis]PNZ98613.1 carboxylesterase [Staphylococcus massiliensis CCUG 55927]